ncbi:MAG: PLP-dependent aspartate aminotransferase family protein [Betaproteobacteria bacterium]|nr:PLP-dependent aspartate aminotransferase family protein [Betaproteobacteria bacterium]
MKIETLLAQAGIHRDPQTGAISTPIYQCATFSHPALGKSTGYDYSRTANPTRSALESVLQEMDKGERACAFASGIAALDATLRLLPSHSRIVVTEDPYGGTIRLLEHFYKTIGITPLYVDTSDTDATIKALQEEGVKALFLELPTNPLLKVAEISKLSEAAHKKDCIVIVDNTFLTPYLFRPLEHGADVAVYSATKYLGGHNDLVAGTVTTKSEALGNRLAFIQNATGASLGPMDSWLLLRGLKTLALRIEQQQANAQKIAEYLRNHPRIKKVYYPGLIDSEGHTRLKQQANGFGAVLSFEVTEPERIAAILEKTKVFSFAESLGGVESLITYPVAQTHADVPEDTRQRLGINNSLLRLSVGIENAADLIADLENVL